MSKRKRFRMNGNNWLLLVVFALASIFAAAEPLVILTGAATAFNLFIAFVCQDRQQWNEESFKRNLTEATIDDKLVSLLLWTFIWTVLLRFDYVLLVACSVCARGLAGIFVRVS